MFSNSDLSGILNFKCVYCYTFILASCSLWAFRWVQYFFELVDFYLFVCASIWLLCIHMYMYLYECLESKSFLWFIRTNVKICWWEIHSPLFYVKWFIFFFPFLIKFTLLFPLVSYLIAMSILNFSPLSSSSNHETLF